MKEEPATPPRTALDALIAEARAETEPRTPHDAAWAAVEGPLFERVARHAAEQRALTEHRGRLGPWLLLSGFAAMAAAAGVALLPRSPASFAPQTAPSGFAISAGDLTLQQGGGEILVSGLKARAGAQARAGATVEARGAKAVFDAPGRSRWVLEDESVVRVERADAPAVLSLERGAIEAEVSPVAMGEAFAVDVAGVRVAVHGTHLRVARDGDRVIVDLSEGVVSIGAPPKVGATQGILVTAPAHVELQAGAPAATLSVDHLPASVRAPVDLRATHGHEAAPSGAEKHAAAPREDRAPVLAPRPASPPPARAAVAARNPNAEQDIASAVRACAAAEPRATDVQVTVSSTIAIKLNEDGSVRLAHFDPPLAPGIQACATRTIFATRFVDAADHSVAITF